MGSIGRHTCQKEKEPPALLSRTKTVLRPGPWPGSRSISGDPARSGCWRGVGAILRGLAGHGKIRPSTSIPQSQDSPGHRLSLFCPDGERSCPGSQTDSRGSRWVQLWKLQGWGLGCPHLLTGMGAQKRFLSQRTGRPHVWPVPPVEVQGSNWRRT